MSNRVDTIDLVDVLNCCIIFLLDNLMVKHDMLRSIEVLMTFHPIHREIHHRVAKKVEEIFPWRRFQTAMHKK